MSSHTYAHVLACIHVDVYMYTQAIQCLRCISFILPKPPLGLHPDVRALVLEQTKTNTPSENDSNQLPDHKQVKHST